MIVLGLLVVVGWLWAVVLDWQWWWIGLWVFFFFGSGTYYFIVVNILLYCDIYIILLY